MIGEQIEERCKFTSEFKNKILLKTKGRCARCGCEVGPDNWSVEHILPISHGGTNDLSNLLMLCVNCNRKKADKIYYPADYYEYYTQECGGVYNMSEIVTKWFQVYKEDFWFEKYPLLSPVISSEIQLVVKGKKINSGRFIDIMHASEYCKTKFAEKFYGWVPNTPHYVVVDRKSSKLIAILAISYARTAKNNKALLAIRVLKSNTDAKGLYAIFSGIAVATVGRYRHIGIPIDIISINHNCSDLYGLINRNPLVAGSTRPGCFHCAVGGEGEYLTILTYTKEAWEYMEKHCRNPFFNPADIIGSYIAMMDYNEQRETIKQMFNL